MPMIWIPIYCNQKESFKSIENTLYDNIKELNNEKTDSEVVTIIFCLSVICKKYLDKRNTMIPTTEKIMTAI